MNDNFIVLLTRSLKFYRIYLSSIEHKKYENLTNNQKELLKLLLKIRDRSLLRQKKKC